MKIIFFRGGETPEEFEKISDIIIHDLVDMRGMPTDNGQFIRTGLDTLNREESTVEIILAVHRVKCSRLDDF